MATDPAAAAARGFSSAWLLYSKAERLVTLVYYDAHTLPRAPDALDIPALAALEAGPALGDEPLSGRAGAGMVGGSSRGQQQFLVPVTCIEVLRPGRDRRDRLGRIRGFMQRHARERS